LNLTTHIQTICKLITQPEETEQSKIFPNEAFGYQKVIVERPLRLSVHLTEKNLRRFERLCADAKEAALYSVVEAIVGEIGEGPHLNYNSLLDAVESKAKEMAVKLPAKSKNFMKVNLVVIDESADPVIKKIHKAGKAESRPLYGLYDTTIDGKKVIVEFEPNTNLRDSESAGDSGSYVAPALWGENSYNSGAGMNRLLTNAAFVHSNMPLGTVWNHPAIINEDTYDVAAYLSSQERPQMRGLEKDYPKLEKKALDCPYPPYADNFSQQQQQHQYGPFQPIKEAHKNK
jgi:hypothetical protein